jgi:ketosteroid isomerase-like protein
VSADDKVAIGKKLHAALVQQDWRALRALLTDDATWTLPGDNQISGQAVGADEVVARAQKIADFGLCFALIHILVSRDNMALSVHNTATGNGIVLDEYLATVCTLRDGKIAEIETYFSDVVRMNAFFA